MELREYDDREPSHIHIPRPSRTTARPTQLSREVSVDLCALFGDDAEVFCAGDPE